MTSTPVVIQLECDSKATQTNHVISKLIEIVKVYLKNMFSKEILQLILDHLNISVPIIDISN
jgi:hypothetical protein